MSSTAHLIIVEQLFHLDPRRFGLTFDVALHVGTALAVLLYFIGTWLALLRDLLAGRWRLPLLIVVGTIPGGIAGALLESIVEQQLRDIRYIAAGLIIGSVVFWLAERTATQRRGFERLGWGDALFVGVAQAIALLPGISRSGITISGGLARGLTRAEATRFSFLLATPIIFGAAAKTVLDARRAAELFADPQILAVGLVVSFVSGLAAVAFMVRFLRVNSLNWFLPYRLALAAALLVIAALGLA